MNITDRKRKTVTKKNCKKKNVTKNIKKQKKICPTFYVNSSDYLSLL